LGTDWGILGNPKMNIKQAKARFTELTGLDATKKNVHKAIWSREGYVADWLSFAQGYTNDNVDIFDARTVTYWTSLNAYLKVLQEMR
jgi:hypothetical protein